MRKFSSLSPVGRSLLAPAAAVLLAWGLTQPSTARAYELIGGSLDLSQRDVRLFDNFLDSQTNDNAQLQPEFPGFSGAELAIWKAVTEWASQLHAGSGAGDPSQPGGLGSGGANFDASFQGNANGVGGTNDNVHSSLSGGSGGVLAYCETPISDGWRIRYYEDWTWDDGPSTNVVGVDLQGVACHEYGHALGLSHSGDSGATMYPYILGSGVDNRSISPDDIAGLQAIYGLAAAQKPRILSVTNQAGPSGPLLTINGQFFAATGNEVWFTHHGGMNDGNPPLLAGVSSTNNGTRIEIGSWPNLLPADAGAGDLFVRIPGNSGSSLSNAWPIDIPTQGAGCTGGVATVQSLFPASAPALVPGGQSLTLLGCNFSSTSSVSVDGQTLPILPPAFQVVSNTTMLLSLPQVSKLGLVDIVITNAFGASAPAQVNILAPATPVIDLNGPYLVGAAGVRVRVGSQPGDLGFLLVSTSLSPSLLAGLFALDIGANFTDLYLLDTSVVPAQAWYERNYSFSGLATGTPLLFQALLFPVATGSFPLVSTSVASGTVLF